MRNECYNFIVFNGHEDDIKRALENLDNVLNYDGLHRATYFKALGMDDMEHEFDVNWIDATIEGHTDTRVVIEAITPNDPPIEFFRYMSKVYALEIMLDYEEMTQDIGGTVMMKDGNITRHDHSSYWKHRYVQDPDVCIESLLANLEEYESYDDFETKRHELMSVMKSSDKKFMQSIFERIRDCE